ncbi:hypothetical protein HMPREF9069_01585 [Atopobium sp. oral taxon 810 str. F0209]|nr:hypothetical protein HMPREF9069_01585 [Atopobium sp. oral taxon 810 str. F0209]
MAEKTLRPVCRGDMKRNEVSSSRRTHHLAHLPRKTVHNSSADRELGSYFPIGTKFTRHFVEPNVN